MSKRYLTVDEAAEFTRMPKGTFWKYRSAIGGSKLGRRWVFSEDELIRFIESKRHKPTRELQTA